MHEVLQASERCAVPEPPTAVLGPLRIVEGAGARTAYVSAPIGVRFLVARPAQRPKILGLLGTDGVVVEVVHLEIIRASASFARALCAVEYCASTRLTLGRFPVCGVGGKPQVEEPSDHDVVLEPPPDWTLGSESVVHGKPDRQANRKPEGA